VRPERAAALASRGARVLAELILATPHRTIPELAALSGLTPRMVYIHLRRFEDCGFIVLPSPRRFTGFRTTERLEAALVHERRVPPRFP